MIPPVTDLWWCEPCAGSGNLLRQMPAERRIGFDINPLDNGEFGIIRADYGSRQLDPTRLWCVFTNPPFSDRGPQRLFAWAAEQNCVRIIALVAPHWYQHPKVENALLPFFHRISRTILAPDSFFRDGERKWCPAIFDIWVRRSYMRDEIVIRTDHPDWEWLPARRKDEADAWMQNWDIGVGRIKRPDNLGRFNSPSLHWFIRELRAGTVERLKQIDWLEVTYPTTARPRIDRGQVVAAYTAAYGDPDADDYAPLNPHSAG